MEPPKRQQILDDTGFWIRLEGYMTEWLRVSPDPLHRRYWIDGFVRESIINTQYGADVIGQVWMAHGRNQELFDFILSVPQIVLYRPEASCVIAEVQIYVEQKRVTILLER